LQATPTATQSPTETPVPTPTLHPQFAFLQNQFFQSETYTITNDGKIEILSGDTQNSLKKFL